MNSRNCLVQTPKIIKIFTAYKVSVFGVFSGPYFTTFRLNAERYSVSLLTQSECGKIQTRKAPNMDIFHAMFKIKILWFEKLTLTGIPDIRGSISLSTIFFWCNSECWSFWAEGSLHKTFWSITKKCENKSLS